MRFSRLIRAVAAAAACLALAAPAARGQLVVGNDAGAGQLWVIDLHHPALSRSLGTGTDYQVGALAADNDARVLYWIDSGTRLLRAPMTATGTLSPAVVGLTRIGTSAVAISSLAFDTTDHAMVAYKNNATGGLEGFYAVSTANAACTPLWINPNTGDDFGGLDYDPDTDAYYACNDSVAADRRGLWRIQKPWASPTFTFLAPYPDGDLDVDGTAVGDGRVYLINDTAAGGAYVYNIATGQYEAPIMPLPFTSAGSNAGGAWAPRLTIMPNDADLEIAVADAPSPLVVPPGGSLTYTVSVTNHGPASAASVVVIDTPPAGAAVESVSPPGVYASGVVTASLGTLAPGERASFDIVVTPPAFGSYTNRASVTTSTEDPIPGNNASNVVTVVRARNADAAAVITGPADCSLQPGAAGEFTFAAVNNGPDPAVDAALAVTIPPGVIFLGSEPPLTPTNGTLALAAGVIPPGGAVSIRATFTLLSPGGFEFTAAVAADSPDDTLLNNASRLTFHVPRPAPAAAAVTGIISTIAASPTSLVPGTPALRFADGGLQQPFRSPDGSRWIMNAVTWAAPATDEVIIVGTMEGGLATVVQEGVTRLEVGELVGPIDNTLAINDVGQYAFATNTDYLAAYDEIIVIWDGRDFQPVVREGDACPAVPGARYAVTNDSVSLQNDGTVSFYATLAGAVGPDDNTAYFADNGHTLLARKGVTVPADQASGAANTCKTLSTGSVEGSGLSCRADGAHAAAVVELNGVDAAEDRALIVDNRVRIQEGHILPGTGFSSPVATNSPIVGFMDPDGTWFAYGSNADGQDWVLRDGVLIAASGTEPVPGAGFTWGDPSFPQTFFAVAGDGYGNTLVGGVTSAPAESNSLLVLNGRTVLARENDPIDLDSNGVFDDALYIRSFLPNRLFLTRTAAYAVVSTRDAATALCAGSDNDRGQVFVRIPIPRTCDPDVNRDGNTDQDDLATLVAILAGGPNPDAIDPDLNHDGNADQDDLAALVNVIAGGPCP
jgi:uncharacterized repeat protein (TIGR01451 family)